MYNRNLDDLRDLLDWRVFDTEPRYQFEDTHNIIKPPTSKRTKNRKYFNSAYLKQQRKAKRAPRKKLQKKSRARNWKL